MFQVDITCNYILYLNNPNAIQLVFRVANEELGQNFIPPYIRNITIGTLNAASNVFPTVEDAIAHHGPDAATWLVNYVNTQGGTNYIARDILVWCSKGVNDQIKKTVIAINGPAGAHINDGATDAATNAPTNLNVLTTVLGTLTGEVNATNAKQNALAAKYNDLSTKFNTLLDRLEAKGILLS